MSDGKPKVMEPRFTDVQNMLMDVHGAIFNPSPRVFTTADRQFLREVTNGKVMSNCNSPTCARNLGDVQLDLEATRAKLATAVKERDDAICTRDGLLEDSSQWEEKASGYRQERDALREALARVVAMTRETPCLPDGVIQQCREALSPGGREEEGKDTCKPGWPGRHVYQLESEVCVCGKMHVQEEGNAT